MHARPVALLLSEHAIGALAQVTVFSISRNEITDAGLATLALAITPVSAGGSGALEQVTFIGLSSNNIGDDGLIKLAEALRRGAMANTKVSSSSLKLSHSHSA